MHRFFIARQSIQGDTVVIAGYQARQIRNVLRLKCGDELVVLDNAGYEYRVQILDIKMAITGKVVEFYPVENEAQIELVLYQALIKGDKFDFVLQKNTELGVKCFVPMLCHRCVAGQPGKSKMDRWRRILTEAAEQSGRGYIPDLEQSCDFAKVCEELDGPSILLWPGIESEPIYNVLKTFQKPERVNIIVGPEGDFTCEEIEAAQGAGVRIASVGKRTLRAETAGLVAASVILYEYGEMGK